VKKIFFFLLLFIVLVPLLYVIFNLIYARLTYYNPSDIEVIYENQTAIDTLDVSNFTVGTWNIGYSGLGAQTDFFYDGGKMVRPSEDYVKSCFDSISNFLNQDSSDIWLLQEVDSMSRRSYELPQANLLSKLKDLFFSFFALNYNVKFIPQPWLEPMGNVKSGLLTLSAFKPYKSIRHQLPGAFGFPKQLYFLRRCLLVNYYKLQNGKDFIVVNIHNSAYDDSGKLKKQEMDYLKSFLEKEYKNGNYIICGGDWNQCPPNWAYNTLAKGKEGDYFQTNVEAKFMNGWSWIFDPNVVTNRKNDKPYSDKTFTTIIDFFLLSPNIKTKDCQGVDLNFAFSDHQPVKINIELIK
jgi:endonuclease/exonuclease/phosphatase family metal-dependent hydrolase